MESVPPNSAVVVKLATPLLNVFVPRDVVPLRNVMLSPFGGAPAAEVTAAVKVTGSPKMEGFGVGTGVSVVVVAVSAGV
jgi:hypothetical protein